MAEARNGGVTIFYETFGDAGDPALLLVNGLGSQCIAYRREWCERFTAEGFFVIRFDNRDVGLSTHLSDVAPDVLGVSAAVAEGRTPSVPYVLADMADDAVAVLDDLGIDRAHVMGLSMGGMIVQQLAIAHPERLRSLTSVMSTTGDPDVGQAHREARALLFGPPATTREEAIARAVQGLHVWGSPEHLDDERTASIAAEAYDRAFDPAGHDPRGGDRPCRAGPARVGQPRAPRRRAHGLDRGARQHDAAHLAGLERHERRSRRIGRTRRGM